MKRTHRLLPLSFESRNALPEIGAAIRDARLARNITQRSLALRAAIGVSTVKRLEAGDPRVALGSFLKVLTILSDGIVEAVVQAVKTDLASPAFFNVALVEIGAGLRTARLAGSMSQRELCLRAAIGISTVKRLEAGDPRVALGRFLEVLTILSPSLTESVVQAVKTDREGEHFRRRAIGSRARRTNF